MPSPTPTYQDIAKAFPEKGLTEEQWDNMPPLMRGVYQKALEDLALIGNAARGTPIPTPPKKTPTASQTPTPAAAGVAIRYGRWVKDPDTAKKYYLGDPRYEETIKRIDKLGGDLSAYLGEDLPPTATPTPRAKK